MNMIQSQGIKGEYKIQVLENGRVVEDRPWASNVVTNQGFNYLLSGTYSTVPDVFRYHAIGTGTTAAANTDVGLVTETKRTGTLVTGTGNCGQTTVTATTVFRRTFDHTVESVSRSYTEHGLSPIPTAGNNLSTRAIIAGGPVTVGIGQQLRVIYDISVVVAPASPASLTVAATGWPVAPAADCTGQVCLSQWTALTGTMDTSGVASGTAFLTASGTTSVSMCSAMTLPGGVGTASTKTAITNSAIQYAWEAYVANSLVRVIKPSQYASTSSFTSTAINGFSVGIGSTEVLAYKWTSAQTKDASHQLLYPSITVTWARV